MKRILIVFFLMLIFCSAVSAQSFYYNKEGGRYYHADPRCSSMEEKYWDSLEEMSIDQVDALGLLGPCSRCVKEEQAAQIQPQIVLNPEEFSVERKLTFGGSEPDSVEYLAMTNDGRIIMAGSTYSSDGTLSDRTKSGRTGWISMVDLTGKTYWNFCSRHGSYDDMMSPVVHDDGSITVLLRSSGQEYDQVELIHLDEKGRVIKRKTLIRTTEERSSCGLEKPGIYSGGYVVSSYENRYKATYHWFDFDGNLRFETEGPMQFNVPAVSENHVIMVIDEAYWLCALDEKGNRSRLVSLGDRRRSGLDYSDLVSLPDGGAMACVIRDNESAFFDSNIYRWNEQGELVSEWTLSDFRAGHAYLYDEHAIVFGERKDFEGYLLLMDLSGNIEKELKIGDVPFYGEAVIMDAEGKMIVSKDVWNGNAASGMANRDVELNVVNIR